MYLDYTYNNAVLQVFIGLLRKAAGERMSASSRSIICSEESESQIEPRSNYKSMLNFIALQSLLVISESVP